MTAPLGKIAALCLYGTAESRVLQWQIFFELLQDRFGHGPISVRESKHYKLEMLMDRKKPKLPHTDHDLEQLRSVEQEAIAAYRAYPGEFDIKGLDPEEAIKLCAIRLRARGIESASSLGWVSEHVDSVVVQVLAKECLLHRLVDILNKEGDIEKALTFARNRGCREPEAYDALEDSIVALIRRGYGLQEKDSLLRYFRTILWEKILDTHEKNVRERARAASLQAVGYGGSAAVRPGRGRGGRRIKRVVAQIDRKSRVALS